MYLTHTHTHSHKQYAYTNNTHTNAHTHTHTHTHKHGNIHKRANMQTLSTANETDKTKIYEEIQTFCFICHHQREHELIYRKSKNLFLE